MELRIPPHSVDAEQAVLGALLLAPDAWWQVAALVKAEDFYRRDHQTLFRALQELDEKGRGFDVLTVPDHLEATGKGGQVDGTYILELATTTPSAANVVAWAEIVADKARLRRLIEVGTDIVNDGFQTDGRDSVELIGKASTAVAALLESQPAELEPVRDVMLRAFQDLQNRHDNAGEIHGLATGWDDLDELTDGLQPGDLFIISARPSMGKTTLALNIAESVAIRQRKGVAVFSFEMSAVKLGSRMISSVGLIDAGRIRSGDLAEEDWSKVTQGIRLLKDAPLWIAKPRSASGVQLIAQLRKKHAEQARTNEPLMVAVIDYLQLMDVETKGGKTTAEALGEITRQLKLTAQELGITIILLSQLNRELEKRVDKRPMMADLRASGAIEQDADVIAFIYRDEVYRKDSPDLGIAEVIVAKQRDGRTDTVRLRYRGHLMRFDNLGDWRPPEQEAKAQEQPMRFRRGAGRDRAAGET